jgi:hypothetical protein
MVTVCVGGDTKCEVVFCYNFFMLAKTHYLIRCKCGKRISIIRPQYQGWAKGHAHCPTCNLEWHLTWEGKVYAHPWKIKGRAWIRTSNKERRNYLH